MQPTGRTSIRFSNVIKAAYAQAGQQIVVLIDEMAVKSDTSRPEVIGRMTAMYDGYRFL